MADDDAARREQEINMFAAFAQGDVADDYSSNTFEAETFSAAANKSEETTGDDERNMFAQAAMEADPSGTFNFQPVGAPGKSSETGGGEPESTKSDGRLFVIKYNLEAAAAALAKDDNGRPASATVDPPQEQHAFLSPHQQQQQQQQQQTQQQSNFPTLPPRTPMSSQKVWLPKPLFFGCQLPPRVIQEAKEILKTCPQGQPPPPEVRNLLSAIRTYGHGLDLEEEMKDSSSRTKPTSYVSVFCPKWSALLPSEQMTDPKAMPTEEGGDDVNPPYSQERTSEPSGQTSVEENGTVSTEPLSVDTGTTNTEGVISERDLFSMWARGDDVDSSVGGGNDAASDGSNSSGPVSAFSRENSMGSMGNAIKRNSSAGSISSDTEIMSDRDLFSQWARGESPRDADAECRMSNSSSNSLGFQLSGNPSAPNADSVNNAISKNNTGSVNFFNSAGTFLNIPAAEDSDDDEVVVSELKKKVGINEHFNAALASMEEDFDPNEIGNNGVNMLVDESTDKMAQVPMTPDGGRPLTNHELMNGVAPLFGIDDSSLPTEADLGIHETRDEQQRSREQRRNQAIIEKCCPQNVFGPLACPNPAMHPEDNHSWNSRTTPPSQPRWTPLSNHRSIPHTVAHSSRLGVLPTLGAPGGRRRTSLGVARSLSPKPPGSRASTADASGVAASGQTKSPHLADKKIDSRLRYGWWNVPEEPEAEDGGKQEPSTNNPVTDAKLTKAASSSSLKVLDTNLDDEPLQLPPLEHSAMKALIQTKLEPQPSTLQKDNQPLSRLHPATSLAQSLPFFSDRPPSTRYLQMDTRTVGFPTIGGEIEPLFCSLVIYHIETLAPNITNDPTLAPIPDLQRCGKVTETLHFDFVSEAQTEERCRQALWPYQNKDGEEKLQGTRCGVFPLPSNLNFHNLYAILTVHKVVSEGSDFEVYLRPGKTASMNAATNGDSGSKLDLKELRSRAQKASMEQGKFIMPFAFGVAPLLQVFGADVPHVPSSRAVQIPLFRFAAGQGDRQIIDHIMVMLYPRADHRESGIGGPAPVTNGGTAMLVMRNFGYLGLHSVIHSKSSLARDRLVDFTREFHMRRREGDDSVDSPVDESRKGDHDADVVPEWHRQFVAEPTVDGGRNRGESDSKATTNESTAISQSPLYAQELSPLRLHPSSTPRPITVSQRVRGHHTSGDDIEPSFHTSFCNELLCHPRLLRHCPKGNIVVKVEMREMQWMAEYGAFLAHLPVGGPAVHNPRRGPFMIQGAYSSCSARGLDPHFLDEFKLRLPLILKGMRDDTPLSGSTSLFFTVYRLSFSSRKKWGKKFRSRKTGKKVDDISGDMAGEDVHANTSCHLIQLACGHLPLAATSSILRDGNHDVKMIHMARELKNDFAEKQGLDISTLVVSEIPGVGEGGRFDTEEYLGDDGESVGSSHHIGDTASATSASESIAISELTEGSRSKGKQKPSVDPICLQIRVSVHSSVHSQNAILGEFLSQESDIPPPLDQSDDRLSKLLRLARDEIHQHIFSSNAFKTPEGHDAEKLLTSTIDISKISMCPMSEVSGHLLRITRQLSKVVVCGTEDSDLAWANPAALIPLRVQAFATLLHLLGSSAIYLAKKGLMQLDGSNKWNLIAMSRVVGLTFDEGSLFKSQAEEAFCKRIVAKPGNDSLLTPASNGQQVTMEKQSRRHVRSNFEFLNNGDTTEGTTESIQGFGSEPNENGLGFSSPNPEEMPLSTPPTNATAASPFEGIINPSESEMAKNTSSSSPILKVDTVTDFRSALKAGSQEDTDELLYDKESSGARAAAAMVKAFSGPQTGGRRWISAPSPHLATIREDADGDDELKAGHVPVISSTRNNKGPLDSLDTELYVNPAKSSVKQMRVPKTTKNAASSSTSDSASKSDPDETFLGPSQSPESKQISDTDPNEGLAVTPFESPNSSPNREPTIQRPKHLKYRSHTLPATDAEIEMAGTSFLDAIEKSLGLGGVSKSAILGEDDRVGEAHHRKTRSTCSIDWSIPNDDLSSLLTEPPSANLSSEPVETQSNEFDESMSTLSEESKTSTQLPNFVDRLATIGNQGVNKGRWFPFAYEVIIMQWAAVLNKQRTVEDKNDAGRASSFKDGENLMADAASRTVGVAIACAPVLFEIIKQSLGWRIDNLFNRAKGQNTLSNFRSLVELDDALMSSLEQIISLIAGACFDSRNFDAWETRQTCIDVNDSIVQFLRDMYAFLDPACVHRLMMIYLSQLVMVNGKWQDRDSNIGLRCAWEFTKLQMNTITALVRFPDFLKINSPQSNTISSWLATATAFSTVSFFDDMLAKYHTLNPQLLKNGEGNSLSPTQISSMRPHWLSEFVIDVCILGIEHAEHTFQRRASSLLLELFWGQSQQSMCEGTSPIVAATFVTFLEKILMRTNYLSSCFTAKSQVRQDIFRCVAFVLQSAPTGLLRALWRKLCAEAPGKGSHEKYGGVGYSVFAESPDDTVNDNQRKSSKSSMNWGNEADIFDMFSLLNLMTATFEYEGSDEHTEGETLRDDDGPHLSMWRKEFLLVRELETSDKARRRRLMSAYGKVDDRDKSEAEYATTGSRKWHSHDSAIVVIRTAQLIVRELRNVLEPSEGTQSFFNPARRKRVATKMPSLHSSASKASTGEKRKVISFTFIDTVIFVRAAASVYLHTLTVRQSDITLVKTINASLEMVKIFGIKIFNEAVGETLQHWMRVISFHCGSRRSEVRVQASDFLELILRSTWGSFGTFFRIRLPLLAVQTEVMERIVATAAARHYREQRMMGLGIDLFSNGSAEASLAPLWRTLDRLHHQSASQNVAFKSALIRLAEKMKKLFRAYIAAHALAFLNKAKAPGFVSEKEEFSSDAGRNLEAQTLIRAARISIQRVINASAGYSKQFLGFYSNSLEHSTVAHNEAVEDAFLAAADVFSPTELPDHRVAWLRKLAEFHSSRHKYAEEATCHYNIHITLQQASRLHGVLWSSTPFLPWTDNMSDGIHLDGEGPAGDPDDASDLYEDSYDNDYGRQLDKTNSFRRIFYRNENSIRITGGELQSGASKYAFYGVTLPSEYNTVSPWISLREMEANMLEEAESAGDLFLRSGIVASSRYAWSLAVRHYAEKFSYGKLAHVYDRLARTVVSQVPPIDSGLQEVSVTVPLGRFYRVWFHGGAPDELIGAEFVYRTASNVRLEQFGKELKGVIRCIIPDKTPIHLVLDGRPEEREEQRYTGFRMGAQLEPVRVKVTPLRCMIRMSRRMRGLPEWFHDYIETAFSNQATRSSSSRGQGLRQTSSVYSDTSLIDRSKPGHREQGSTYSASMFSSSGPPANGTRKGGGGGGGGGGTYTRRLRHETFEGELVGADKFSFMQPINKGRGRGTRDWLRGSSGDFAAKTLRVTQLQVGQSFPACVSRQAVVHRVVFTQSPLEAALDSIYQWCSIIFRTAIATNGQIVLAINYDPGIGIEAAKVLSDCIHSSRVKEMGMYLLRKNTNFEEEEEDILHSYDRLAEDEVKKLQLKLSRSLIVFMELLHLMIARNRDLLLDVIQERKRGEHGFRHGYSASLSRGDISLSDGRSNRSVGARQSNMNANDSLSDGRSRDDMSTRSHHKRNYSSHHSDDASISSGVTAEKARTDSAIGIQSELQRAFISISKELFPKIHGIMGSETPRWLKLCTQENYFSSSIYRQAKIAMGEELAFEEVRPRAVDAVRSSGLGRSTSTKSQSSAEGQTIPLYPFGRSSHGTRMSGSPGGSLGSGSVASKGSDAGRSHQSGKISFKSNDRVESI